MRSKRHSYRVFRLAALSCCVLTGCASVAVAQAPEEVKSKLEVKTKELESTRGRQRALESDVAALDKERERINARLLETADLIQKSEARMSAIEARLGDLTKQEAELRGSLDQRRDQLATLLAVLQKMGRNPPPVMVTKREDALGMVRSGILLAATFPELSTQALELTQKLDDLVKVADKTRSEGERLKAETARLNDARIRLSGLMAEKKSSLSERQAELSRVRQTTDEISKSVKTLQALIDEADRATARSNSRISEHNSRAELAVREAESDPATAGIAGSSAPEVMEDGGDTKETQVAVLAPAPSQFGSASAGRIEPAIPFHLAKGRLPYPTAGKHVLSFGQETEYGGKSKGLVFQTRYRAQITSPTDGWIVYAGEFRSYGQLLIINAGGGYHVLLAGLSRIDVEPGQFVLAAEPVGTMGDAPPSVQRGSEDAKPVLYVEFRKDGRPIDPDPWWVKDPEKVQG